MQAKRLVYFEHTGLHALKAFTVKGYFDWNGILNDPIFCVFTLTHSTFFTWEYKRGSFKNTPSFREVDSQ